MPYMLNQKEKCINPGPGLQVWVFFFQVQQFSLDSDRRRQTSRRAPQMETSPPTWMTDLWRSEICAELSASGRMGRDARECRVETGPRARPPSIGGAPLSLSAAVRCPAWRQRRGYARPRGAEAHQLSSFFFPPKLDNWKVKGWLGFKCLYKFKLKIS